MNILPTDSVFNIAVLVLVIALLLGFAGLLVAIYNFISRWLGLLQTEKTSGANEVLDAARQEALKLVQDANLKAQAIVAEAGDLSEESKASIESALRKLATEQEVELKQVLEKQKDISLHTIKQATKTIQEGVLDEVSQFGDIVHKETIESEKLVEEKVNRDYQVIKEEIERYKAEELAKIDESIFNILKEVSTQVLGRALSMEGHRDLVIDALEEAKRHDLFEIKHDDIRR